MLKDENLTVNWKNVSLGAGLLTHYSLRAVRSSPGDSDNSTNYSQRTITQEGKNVCKRLIILTYSTGLSYNKSCDLHWGAGGGW